MTTWTRMDIKQCNSLSATSPKAMRYTALMAVLSIQQSWHTVPAAMDDVVAKGSRSRFLWGFKRNTYEYLDDPVTMDHLYSATLTEQDPVKLLDLWTTVPGIGLAKAGFVVQLTRGMVGCVDGHNAEAYDVAPSALVFPKGRMTVSAQQNKLESYVRLCENIGGSEFMWQQWCELMAGRWPTEYRNAEAVSRQHVTILEGAIE